MTYLLCTLTDQHIPNLLSVHHFKPDILFLLATPEMISKTEYFLSALKLGGKDYSEPKSKIIKLNHAEDVDQLNMKIEELVTEYKDGNWIINLTGGTKWLNIALFDFFKSSKEFAHFIYSPNKYPTQFLEWNSGHKIQSNYQISIEEFLMGYEFKISKPKPFQNHEKELEIAIQIAKNYPDSDLLYINDRERWDKAREKGIELNKGELLIPSQDIKDNVKFSYGLEEFDDGSLKGRLGKDGGLFFTGGWLEIFFAGLIKRFSDYLKVWDIQINVQPKTIQNELDVIFMHKNKLFLIECKSGNQDNDPNSKILYQNTAVAKSFNALGINPILATTSPNLLKDGQIKDAIKVRADLYNITILTAPTIQAIAEHADDYTVLKDALFPPKKPNTLS